MNIIIADDHTVVRQGLKQILAAEPDMRVVGEAKNFGETLEVARNLDWDVLILDYSMPGGNDCRLISSNFSLTFSMTTVALEPGVCLRTMAAEGFPSMSE